MEIGVTKWHAKIKQKSFALIASSLSLWWYFMCQNKFQLAFFIQQCMPTITIFTVFDKKFADNLQKTLNGDLNPSNGLILLKRSYQSYSEKICKTLLLYFSNFSFDSSSIIHNLSSLLLKNQLA